MQRTQRTTAFAKMTQAISLETATPSDNHISQRALIEQLRIWESIVSRSPDAVCITDDQGVIEYVNAAFERLFGYRSAAILGQRITILDAPSAQANLRRATFVDQAHPDGSRIDCELPPLSHDISLRETCAHGSWQGTGLARHRDGRPIAVRISAIRRSAGVYRPNGHLMTYVDVSETKKRERQLQALRTVAEDLSTRLGLADMVEHALDAAVGLTETDVAALAILTEDGQQLRYPWCSELPDPALRPRFQAPFSIETSIAGRALRAGHELCLSDGDSPGDTDDPLHGLGVRSAIAYPINIHGQDPAVLCVAQLGEQRHFEADTVQLLATIARQIGVAIDRDRLMREARASSRQLDEIIHRNPDAILITDDDGCVRFANPAAQRLLERDEAELQGFPLGLTSQTGAGELDVHRPNGERVPVELHAMETSWENQRAHVLTLRDLTDRRQMENERRASADRIRKALIQTIEAISRTVETRDPYTAGHQRRVAVLGREMAAALGLDQDVVDGVYMGGTIHDIGKLYIPAEILNRPGKLNEIEFLLIKTHCAVGRDIIGGIEFPWPLGDMVHQHHERLDGSGYPQGLSGDDILLQARILAIADVVDAMSSRRPYRESLGLDAALAEIERGRGSRYDPDATEVCIRLFRQRHLSLDDLEAGA